MNQQTLRKLEFDKIVERLARCCTSTAGSELVNLLRPMTAREDVESRLGETTEAREILRLHPLVPLGGIRDVRQPLQRAFVGGVLGPSELLEVLDTVAASRRLKIFCMGLEKDYPRIQALAMGLGVYKEIEKRIEGAIEDDGRVADNASPELMRIRRQIRHLQERIKASLERIIRSPDQQKMLQEFLITMRNDRYVVPVKQECRNQFPGLVHDQSASGATVFIEPMAVVELNNELRRLHAAEQNEINVILQGLSDLLAREATTLKETVENLAWLDFIFAKGRLSQDMNAWEPLLNYEGRIKLVQARHPLIAGQVVPISVTLGENFDTLVITGPNTGGKTVTLKTIGLLTMMAQAGLHVPAEEGTLLAVYGKIFADIGDEQSIEQSLSTFSSHMINIVGILKEADQHSLVLLDELGAGTDPTEGAALAMSILEALYSSGAKTVATTHYGQLKAYAYTTPRVENASAEFDVQTLQPTYRLRVGLPGRSNAFEIATRLGLTQKIVERAQEFLSHEEIKVADLLQNLDEAQTAAQRDREAATMVKAEVEELKASLEDQKLEADNRVSRLLQEAMDEARQVVKGARREAEKVIEELRVTLASEAQRVQAEASRQALQKLRTMENLLDERSGEYRTSVPGQAPACLRPGDRVEIPRFGQKGYVITGPNSQREVLVQIGMLKINIKLEDLRFDASRETAINTSTTGKVSSSKSRDISPEIDLRGLTAEEALQRVDKYLDDAFLAGLARVSLIHGKGTGVLRQTITEYLKEHPQVRGYRLGVTGEGGSGVTVVELSC
ncbi:MAG: endonuclease MutS2 [Bacillota bacterium]